MAEMRHGKDAWGLQLSARDAPPVEGCIVRAHWGEHEHQSHIHYRHADPEQVRRKAAWQKYGMARRRPVRRACP